jgi:DcuC family C4-dicarboxylate transporter
MTLLLGIAVIAVAVFAVVRRVDVRLALVLAALVLGALAGDPAAIVRTFLATLAKEQFVVPICSAMGFAYVLRHTECDQHLVHLLVEPIRRVRPFLIPGSVVVGFFVNIPVISQTSTAVTMGTVLVPLLRAARISPVTVGAALLLGSSLGGELLNPGAPELRTVSTALGIASTECVARVFPLLLVQLGVATSVFWLTSNRLERRCQKQQEAAAPEAPKAEEMEPFRVNVWKAGVTLIPLMLLFLTGPPLRWLAMPPRWLVDPQNLADQVNYSSRLIGAAMLVGVAAATLVARKTAWTTTRAFFEGAGYAFTHISSLIVAAACFGEGVKLIGLASLLDQTILTAPAPLFFTAGGLPLGFAVLSGSGMAATQSLFGVFVEPARSLALDPVHVGAVVSIAAAAGRTMSPVAAVTLMCASMTENDPLALAKRVAGPLALGVLAVVLVAYFTGIPR